MQILKHKQGTPEWLAHRMAHHNASDAPAMMGCSKYKTRTQLVTEAATGLSEEVSADTQRLYDAGHAYEGLARPGAEKIVGEDLYPVTGYEGNLSASFDGLTLDDRIAWEHKSLNDALRAILPESTDGVGDDSIGAQLPLMYRVQMEQQALISGCERVLFTASKWQGETCIDSRHCWYRPDPELRAQIVAGWAQFEADVAAWKPAEVAAEVVAEPVEALPAVLVKVSGELAVTANFGAFETKLRDFLEHRLIREPKTDQDFADLDQQIKAMKAGREAIKGAKAQMLAQVQPVDVATKTADMLDDLLQKNCAMAERLLKDEKERRKTQIVVDRQTELREHCANLSARVGVIVAGVADFGGAVKGLKSLASMEDKLDAELARAKIAASQAADLIDGNRKAMEVADAAGLFPDFASVCTKAADDFSALIAGRRAAAAERLERERERIRAEEAARLEREQKAREEAAAREAAQAQARADAEARAEAQRLADSQRQQQEAEARAMAREAIKTAEAIGLQPAAPAPAPEVRAFVAPAAPAVAELPTLTLGQIGTRLGFTVTADFLAGLGFDAHKEKASRLYRPSLFPAICEAISAHVLLLGSEAKKAA